MSVFRSATRRTPWASSHEAAAAACAGAPLSSPSSKHPHPSLCRPHGVYMPRVGQRFNFTYSKSTHSNFTCSLSLPVRSARCIDGVAYREGLVMAALLSLPSHPRAVHTVCLTGKGVCGWGLRNVSLELRNVTVWCVRQGCGAVICETYPQVGERYDYLMHSRPSLRREGCVKSI